jgi:tetratricopeptide (TPR) repeat protein
LECYRKSRYEMSPAVRKWGEVQQILKILGSEQDCEETDILPDNIPSSKVIIERGMFGLRSGLHRHGAQPRICNDLHNLPNVLVHNLYACIRSLVDGDDVPVESNIDDLKHRISLMRLRHQADRIGLRWNPHIPWLLERKEVDNVHVHSADLIPDSPSDWIPYDPEMCKSPWDFKNYFNTKDYGDIEPASQSFIESSNTIVVTGEEMVAGTTSENKDTDDEKMRGTDSEDSGAGEPRKECSLTDSTVPSTSKTNVSSFEEDDDETNYVVGGHNLLYQTMLNLKDAGNEALQAKELDLAARRYDKAIQYGAVASMSFPAENLDFAKGRKEKLKANGGHHLEWTPLVKVLVICRLNLALLMLKPHFGHPDHAAEQSRLALRELGPFCSQKGKVMKGSKMNVVFREDESEETYIEAMGLQAKTYFRLGSAHFDMGEYGEAIRFFDSSVKTTRLSNSKQDNLVLRRLSEAKRESKRKSKRQKRFRFSFTDNGENQGGGSQDSS